MPKEQINYANAIVVDAGSTVTDLMQPPGPEFAVHWGGAPGAEYVQISVEFNLKQVEEYIRQVRKDSPLDSIGFLYSDTLHRDDLQRTIRALKRARNVVFGADE